MPRVALDESFGYFVKMCYQHQGSSLPRWTFKHKYLFLETYDVIQHPI